MKKRDLLLWISVLGGPIVWLVSFEARFALVPWACTFQSKAALFGVFLAALALCAVGATIGWRQWRALGENRPTSEGGAFWRSNFMAIGGMALSAGCGMILVAQAIPEFMLGACQ
jgi:hypothetical protein